MQTGVKGFVHSTESFGSVDGPGVRFVVFMQGCRMRCQFCHNPDTWTIGKGTAVTSREIFNQACQYREFWGKRGGITVSGGEPMLQIDFLIDLFTRAKKVGIHTTLDTCGQPFQRTGAFFSRFQKLMQLTDLVLLDIKHIDSTAHKHLTMWPNTNIIDMANYLAEINKSTWIRHVLVPQRNDYDDYLKRLDAFIKTLSNVKKVEILPYHTMGVYKWKALGIDYPLKGIKPPSEDRVRNANALLHTQDYQGYQDDTDVITLP